MFSKPDGEFTPVGSFPPADSLLGNGRMCNICHDREAAEGYNTCCKTCKATKGQRHTVECHQMKVKKDQEENEVKADAEVAMRIVEVETTFRAAKNADQIRIKKEEAWEFLKKAMRIDDETMAIHDRAASMMGLVKMAFLAVIVGCELDLYAFIMSWPGYWNMPDPNHQIEGLPVNTGWGTVEITVIKLLLVVGPIGYILSVGIYLRSNNGQDEENAAILPHKKQKINHRMIQDEDEEAPLFDVDKLPEAGYATAARKKINLRYFHFLPIVRYYLLIKDTEPDDMEGLFRVNALSTFTLGIVQIVCMMFHQFVVKAPWTIFIKVGIFTQCWNIGVTLLYFLTPACTLMMASIAVDTLKHSVEEDIRKLTKRYLSAVQRQAQSPKHTGQLNQLISCVDQEIVELGRLGGEPSNVLHEFAMEWKLEALGALRRIQYLKFAQIGK